MGEGDQVMAERTWEVDEKRVFFDVCLWDINVGQIEAAKNVMGNYRHQWAAVFGLSSIIHSAGEVFGH